MYAVRNRTDWYFLDRTTWPQIFPLCPADRAMQTTDAVAVRRQFQRHNGHAEVFAVVVRIVPAQSEQLVHREAETADVVTEIPFHQVGRKVVVAGGNRSMRRE